MVKPRRTVIILALAMGLAALAPITAPRAETLDGAWRYDRLAGSVRYPGTLRIRNGVGVNRVDYMLDGMRTIVEFEVKVERRANGVVFRPTSQPRFVEQGRETTYNADIFTCRWTLPTLTCTNVDTAGQADTRGFVMSR